MGVGEGKPKKCLWGDGYFLGPQNISPAVIPFCQYTWFRIIIIIMMFVIYLLNLFCKVYMAFLVDFLMKVSLFIGSLLSAC